MRRPRLAFALAVPLALLAAASVRAQQAAPYTPGPQNIQLPEDWERRFFRYATARVDAAGNPLLDQRGRFIPEPAIIAIGVQEKRAGWGVGYPPEKRNGEWEYARFNRTHRAIRTST